jgi:hypothetical protein
MGKELSAIGLPVLPYPINPPDSLPWFFLKVEYNLALPHTWRKEYTIAMRRGVMPI